MEAPKRYLVDIEEEGGKVTSHGMKTWLREHPAFLPKGMTTDAALAVPGVTLLEYEVNFKLKDAGFTVGEGA